MMQSFGIHLAQLTLAVFALLAVLLTIDGACTLFAYAFWFFVRRQARRERLKGGQ